MNDWQLLVLGEALDGLFDRRGITPKKMKGDWSESGVQVISAKLIVDGRLDLTRERRYVPLDVYERWMPEPLRPGDVLLTSEAPLGEAAVVKTSDSLCLGQRLFALRPNNEVLDSRFLYFWLRSPFGRSALAERSSGTTVLGIRQAELIKVEVPAPPIEAQRAIGGVLGAIDDLIENNRRRVEVLEEMARAIYREWFVRFRYPGHEDVPLVDSPLGPIPDGWTVRPLIEVADITMGQSPKSEFYNSDGLGKPFHQGVTDFGRHYPTHRKFCTVDARLAQDGDILVSVRAPVGRINLADTTLVIGRGLAAVRSTAGHQSFMVATLREVFSEEDSMGGGTIFNAIRKKDLEQIPIVQPPDGLVAVADDRLAAGFRLIRSLTFASRELAAIRNLLLPKLVTGQIDVSHLDLDALTEAASV